MQNRRLRVYQKIITYFFIFNIIFYIINDAFFRNAIPLEIIGYMFFLSLGIYIGFHVCIHEIKRQNIEQQN